MRDRLNGGRPPGFDPEAGETVVLPDAPGAGHWAGAPSVVVAGHDRVLLSYRRRRPRDGSPDERGYLAAIAESTDGGRTFTDIWRISKHEVGTSSLERSCLRRAPEGDWLLYTSWEDPPSSGKWRVDVMRSPVPEGFSLSSSTSVLLPGDLGVDAVKDPYVVADEGKSLMFVSTFLTPEGPAPTWLATSSDGVNFVWGDEALGVGLSWDGYQARLSSASRFGDGFVGYYDGAASRADDTEEHCGVAVSLDLRRWRRVTTERPALVSPHATGSLRYVEVVAIQGLSWAYYEYARPDGSHELRRNLLPGAHFTAPASMPLTK
ncbi:MAG: hypothetical protein ACLQVK_01095 [Acidimicrobiales bacterium]